MSAIENFFLHALRVVSNARAVDYATFILNFVATSPLYDFIQRSEVAPSLRSRTTKNKSYEFNCQVN